VYETHRVAFRRIILAVTTPILADWTLLMIDLHSQISLSPIGVVNSSVLERRDMPTRGARAEVEIFPEYRDGLLMIEGNTHLWIITWLVGAEREQLQIVRPEYIAGQRRRGVFGLRSTTRPNSIGLCVSTLVEVRDGTLTLDHLDFLDGTPVLDIKRYSPSWDSVFSARSSRELMIFPDEASDPDLLELDAARFHGSLTPEIVSAARLVQRIISRWQVLPRDPALRCIVPASGAFGVYCDAIQGMTAATFGTGRLRTHQHDSFSITDGTRSITAVPLPIDGRSTSEVRQAAIDTLFSIEGE
jgi:tRNA (adenine37-N6)-methyltransferase